MVFGDNPLDRQSVKYADIQSNNVNTVTFRSFSVAFTRLFTHISSLISRIFVLKFIPEHTGAWCNGSTPAFEAVDLGSTPSAPALLLNSSCGGVSFYSSISSTSENTVSRSRGTSRIKVYNHHKSFYAELLFSYFVFVFLIQSR